MLVRLCSSDVAGRRVLPLNRYESSSRVRSDLSDARWALIEPILTGWRQQRVGLGIARVRHDLREIVNAILYVNRTGIAWEYLPHDFPPFKTVYDYYAKWETDGTAEAVHDALREKVRVAAGHDPAPSAAIIDSQSVKTSGNVAESSQGFDMANYLGWLVMPGRTLRCWCRGGRPGITTGFPGRSGAGRSGGSVSCSGRVVWSGPGLSP